MNAPATITIWHQSDEAQAILDRLTADDVFLVTETPLFGDRYFRWAAPDLSDDLDRVRRAAIDEAYGTPWADLPDTEARLDYLAFDRSQPSVADVLADLFGAPDSLGSPPQWMIHGDGIDADMRDRARYLANLSKGQRAFVRGGLVA